MKVHLSILLFFIFSDSHGQTTLKEDLVFWSSTKKLTIEDFGIKASKQEASPSYGQFSMDYQINGFSFMAKNLNKNVRNYLIKSASWINTTSNVSETIRYQQTLFDICEIYTRQFRKALRENRGKIASGTKFIEELNSKTMADFSKRRLQYELETNSGTIAESQDAWELQIKQELIALEDFANE